MILLSDILGDFGELMLLLPIDKHLFYVILWLLEHLFFIVGKEFAIV